MRMQAYRRSVAADAAIAAMRERQDGGRYGEGGTAPRLPVIAAIAALHAAGLYALVALDIVAIAKPPPRLTVVEMIREVAPPAPAPVLPDPAPPKPSVVQVVAPPPIVAIAAPPASPVRTVQAPPPPGPEPVAAAPAASTGPPVEALVPPDFGGGQVGNAAPRYPVESRRKREQGTVVLRVVVEANGQPGDCSVRRSSGHERLDKAALATVCRWRFQPATRGGTAVAWPMDVPIPFVLRS